MLAYPIGKRAYGQTLFHRVWFDKEERYKWKTGSLKEPIGLKNKLQNIASENALFLSLASGCSQIQSAYLYLSRKIRFDFKYKEIRYILGDDNHYRLTDDCKKFAIQLLSSTGFCDKDSDLSKITKLSKGESFLLALAVDIHETFESGGVRVFDDMDEGLHPKVIRYIIGLFNNKELNPKNAQLLFSAHNTSILDKELFRRDQIYFCEKTRNTPTELICLAEYKTVKGRENLELNYLLGRYGALPYISRTNLIGE